MLYGVTHDVHGIWVTAPFGLTLKIACARQSVTTMLPDGSMATPVGATSGGPDFMRVGEQASVQSRGMRKIALPLGLATAPMKTMLPEGSTARSTTGMPDLTMVGVQGFAQLSGKLKIAPIPSTTMTSPGFGWACPGDTDHIIQRINASTRSLERAGITSSSKIDAFTSPASAYEDVNAVKRLAALQRDLAVEGDARVAGAAGGQAVAASLDASDLVHALAAKG